MRSDLREIDNKIGKTLTNRELSDLFICSTQGGMRRSRTTNTLVLITDLNGGLYKDRWEDDLLYYTGMGLTGDQKLDKQILTLYRSSDSDISIFLVEKLSTDQYLLHGQVRLARTPFVEDQTDVNGRTRSVWVFPIVVSKNQRALISEEQFSEDFVLEERKAIKRSLRGLLSDIKHSPRQVGFRDVVTRAYQRDPRISAAAKLIANGICQLCEETAPFNDNSGQPFLEVHHIKWLSAGGTDTLDNVTALCPNCHRKMHLLGLDRDVDWLNKKNRLITFVKP